jgi:Ca2+-binding RTX toxin-like protein
MATTIRLQKGVTEGDIASAIGRMQSGDTLVLPENQTIAISRGLRVDVTNRDITIDLNGSTLRQAGDCTVISGGGTMASAVSVKLGAQGANATLTYSSVPSGVKVGDWIKVAADDVLPHDNRNTALPTRLGQALEVIGIEGNTVVLKGKPLYAESYKSNVRAAEIQSGELTIVNGTVQGNQSQNGWKKDLVNIRSAVDAHLEKLTVRDGNSMGVNLVNNVNSQVIDCIVINLKDSTTTGNFGYGIHSAMSVGTTVIGLYAEKTRHATDNNGVGIPVNQKDLSKYGADIGMVVKDTVTYGNTAFSFSWHSEGRNGVLDNVMSFDSHGFVGLRGVGNKVLNSASVNDQRGLQFYEYGYGDAKDLVVDNVVMKETEKYAYVAMGKTQNNVISNSHFEYAKNPGNPGAGTKLVGTRVEKSDGNDNDNLTGTGANDRLLGGKGTDVLNGAGGDDYLWGGKGADRLTGGEGKDRFAFHQGSEAGDVITDFRAGDIIDLSVLAARHGWRGEPVAAGYVRFVPVNGGVELQIDVNGGGNGFVTYALLQGVKAGEVGASAIQTLLSGAKASTGRPVQPGPSTPDPVDPTPTNPTPLPEDEEPVDEVPEDEEEPDDEEPEDETPDEGETPDGEPETPGTPEPDQGGGRGRTVVGTNGDDRLQGGSGADMLDGRSGDDVLQGGAGADMLRGGTGMDLVSYASAASGVTVNLARSSENTGDAKGDRFGGIEGVIGSSHDDVLKGSRGMDLIEGGAGDDALFGFAAMDILKGGAGDDTLDGGERHDELFGGDGADVLIGGAGLDDLTGGAGADTFRFNGPREGRDTIFDFNAAQDTIALSRSGFGIRGEVDFVEGTRAEKAGPSVIYDDARGRLLWDADGSGRGAAVEIATLANKPQLTDADLMFF